MYLISKECIASCGTVSMIRMENTAVIKTANTANPAAAESKAKSVSTAGAEGRKKAADIVCLLFDMLVLALVVWIALPALDEYTSAGMITPGAVTDAERTLEPDTAGDENSIFNKITIENEQQAAILDALRRRWPESKAPWENGYQGLCETWVCDVYASAGLPVSGSCCASESRDRHAVWSEDIPVGAMIYSGPEYLSGYPCEDCGKDPGHVAIYIGDGKVAGSQPTYILTLDEFKEYFGYGGWSFGGNYYETE